MLARFSKADVRIWRWDLLLTARDLATPLHKYLGVVVFPSLKKKLERRTSRSAQERAIVCATVDFPAPATAVRSVICAWSTFPHQSIILPINSFRVPCKQTFDELYSDSSANLSSLSVASRSMHFYCQIILCTPVVPTTHRYQTAESQSNRVSIGSLHHS